MEMRLEKGGVVLFLLRREAAADDKIAALVHVCLLSELFGYAYGRIDVAAAGTVVELALALGQHGRYDGSLSHALGSRHIDSAADGCPVLETSHLLDGEHSRSHYVFLFQGTIGKRSALSVSLQTAETSGIPHSESYQRHLLTTHPAVFQQLVQIQHPESVRRGLRCRDYLHDIGSGSHRLPVHLHQGIRTGSHLVIVEREYDLGPAAAQQGLVLFL